MYLMNDTGFVSHACPQTLEYVEHYICLIIPSVPVKIPSVLLKDCKHLQAHSSIQTFTVCSV